MPDRIGELLHRNLQEVFGEGNAARRRAAIEDLYTEDCVLYVPPGIFVGLEALDKFAGDLRATHPNFVYTPHGEAQALHNAGRLAWGSGPGDEPPNYTGLDVVIVRDGKIAALYGRIQAVVATRSLSADRRNWSSASAGVFQSSVFRGRELRAAATAAISSAP